MNSTLAEAARTPITAGEIRVDDGTGVLVGVGLALVSAVLADDATISVGGIESAEDDSNAMADPNVDAAQDNVESPR